MIEWSLRKYFPRTFSFLLMRMCIVERPLLSFVVIHLKTSILWFVFLWKKVVFAPCPYLICFLLHCFFLSFFSFSCYILFIIFCFSSCLQVICQVLMWNSSANLMLLLSVVAHFQPKYCGNSFIDIYMCVCVSQWLYVVPVFFTTKWLSDIINFLHTFLMTFYYFDIETSQCQMSESIKTCSILCC